MHGVPAVVRQAWHCTSAGKRAASTVWFARRRWMAGVGADSERARVLGPRTRRSAEKAVGVLGEGRPWTRDVQVVLYGTRPRASAGGGGGAFVGMSVQVINREILFILRCIILLG